jgi:predicted Na+-dependent transporter
MVSESVELIISINVEVVFVRLMVLAVIGSHLTGFWMSEIVELEREKQIKLTQVYPRLQ